VGSLKSTSTRDGIFVANVSRFLTFDVKLKSSQYCMQVRTFRDAGEVPDDIRE